MKLILIGLLITLGFSSVQAVDSCPAIDATHQTALIQEHLGTTRPSADTIFVRRGHVYAYDFAHNVPKWTAWHVTKAYTDTPERKKHWYSMGQDKSLPVANRVSKGDYTNSGFDRGHLAPYFTSGGDRDGDGMDAEFENKPDWPIEDIDDACTVFEINYMSNMTPQLPDLNSRNGSWYQLETLNREAAKESDQEFHIIAGPIYASATPEVICRAKNADKSCKSREVAVPDAFFKIVKSRGQITAYLFHHRNRISPGGCEMMPKLSPENCVVPIADIEVLSGLTLQ